MTKSTDSGREAAVIIKEETRKHLEIISAHATRLAEPFIAKGLSPGRLQLVFIYPVGETVQHMQYDLGDIEGMFKDAIIYAEMGWNVYVEGRTVRSDARVGRGKIEDTVFVWAWFIDDDADKGKASEVNVKASLLVESSPGNSHTWILPNRGYRQWTPRSLAGVCAALSRIPIKKLQE